MVFAGTFDKHPKLKMVIGHMGEMLPVMLARLDEVSAADAGHLKRLPSKTITDQVWITTSGIFTQPPFMAALQTFGIDRIMFRSTTHSRVTRKAASSWTRWRVAGRHGQAHATATPTRCSS